jgi:predicted aldo/keto reductase-like oxidoreductase
MVARTADGVHIYQFEEKVWPRAAKKEIGLVAMKVFGGSTKTPKGARMPDTMKQVTLRYALGLPQVSVVIVGIYDAEELKQNLAWLKAYKSLSSEELRALDQPTRELARKWDKPYGPVA